MTNNKIHPFSKRNNLLQQNWIHWYLTNSIAPHHRFPKIVDQIACSQNIYCWQMILQSTTSISMTGSLFSLQSIIGDITNILCPRYPLKKTIRRKEGINTKKQEDQSNGWRCEHWYAPRLLDHHGCHGWWIQAGQHWSEGPHSWHAQIYIATWLSWDNTSLKSSSCSSIVKNSLQIILFNSNHMRWSLCWHFAQEFQTRNFCISTESYSILKIYVNRGMTQ